MKHHYLADRGVRNLEIADGKDCVLFDPQGKAYIDFLAGWCVGTVGWKNKEIEAAVAEEYKRGIYVPPVFHVALQEAFAEKLIGIAPGTRLNRAYRCTSGSEAVDMAIKCARAATGKKKIVSVEGVYHGHTYGAASVGAGCTPEMSPCVPECVKIPMPNAYRGVSAEFALREFEELLKLTDDIAAFISEPVWTNAGVIIPPDDFYPAIQEICRRESILFIMDEVATGFGRTGKMFASELWGLDPDILCLGKGLTGGYATMGATLVSEAVFAAAEHIPDYSTFGWLSLDLAAAAANVDIIVRDSLWKNSARMGEWLLEKMKSFEELPYVGEVRGKGLLLGIEIVKNKESKEPDYELADRISEVSAEAGLIIETAGNVLFMSPALVLTEEVAKNGVAILTAVLESLVKKDE